MHMDIKATNVLYILTGGMEHLRTEHGCVMVGVSCGLGACAKMTPGGPWRAGLTSHMELKPCPAKVI